MRSIGRIAVYATLALGVLWPRGALAQLDPQHPPAPCTAPPAPAQTRTSCFAYNSTTGLLIQEVVEPQTASLRLQTDYFYDSFGNKIQTLVSGVDITARLTTTSFSSNGQFPATMTNALNQSETWQYDTRFGKPTSHTGPNGITTTWTYDSFGRRTFEKRAFGTASMTQTAWTYQFCSGVNGGTATCAAGASYLVQATPLAADGQTQNGPVTIAYFDSLDRQIGLDTQGFNGATIRVSSQYDVLGRLLSKSRPYFVSGGTQELTSYSYDVLGRIIKESLPDGNTIQHAYHGLVTTDTNQNNQTRTITKNSQGQVTSVADAQVNITTYYYDPFGNLLQTVDATGKNVVVNSYDLRGRKTQTNDPDLGTWSYTYNTLSQLVSQIDAKNQPSQTPSAQFIYDLLGRLIERDEADLMSCWFYDIAANGIGKLATARTISGGKNCQDPQAATVYQRALSYDSLSRPCQVRTTIANAAYVIAAGNGTPQPGSCNANPYDANGRLTGVTYPSTFAINYGYTPLGYVQNITDTGSGQVYWTANQRDAELHLLLDTAGNGIATARGFDAPTGRLTSIVAGTSNLVASFSYSYDGVGNLTNRTDGNTGVAEGFGYDSLNRLIESSLTASGGGDAVSKFFSYDSLGNLLTKSDVGNYAYPEPGLPRPHGVLSIDGDLITATFSYDANGNQTNASGSSVNRIVTYASYNKPSCIQQGTKLIAFNDDVDHQRFQLNTYSGSCLTLASSTLTGSTRYLDAFGVHAEVVLTAGGAVLQWNDYIMVGGSMVGVRFLQGSSATLRYFHQDHLGSIAVLTDQNGMVVERDAYDPWGKRRFLNGNDDPTDSIVSQTIRGFTGQEMLASVGLVHLNGRVYDPYIGRMMSADPVVGDPLSGQSWNRYSYVWNNPLAFTDPSGYCPLCLGEAFSRVANGIGKFLQRNPLVGQALVIASAAVCTVAGGGPICAGIASSVSNFIVTGLSTGRLDMALKAAAITAATAAAFYAVGDITLGPMHTPAEFGSPAFFGNVAGHALVGCGASVASGGKCGPGAVSAAIPAFAGPVVNDLPFQAALMASTTLGGLASVAGGGKFANGAVTGAFGYLFNAEGKKGGGKGLVAVDTLLWAITPTTANLGDFVGAWRTVPDNGMSDRAAAYQMQIAGSAPDQAFVVGGPNGVRFDGYNGTALLEAKGPGYAQFVGSNGQFEPWFEGSQNLVDQARSQLSVANGASIEWHIAEPEAFTAIQRLFSANNITGINLVVTPARP